MDLGGHILNILLNQPKVYVDGLGRFARVYISAKYDEENELYLPPITYIEFDRFAKDGFDFTRYLQKTKKIDYKAAQKEVAEKVEEIQTELVNKSSVFLDNLGYLISHGEGFVFKPLDLSGFNFEPVREKELKVPTKEENKKDPTIAEVEEQAKPVVKDIGEEVHIDSQHEEEGRAERSFDAEEDTSVEEVEIAGNSIQKNRSVWYVLGAIVLMIFIGYFVYSFINQSVDNNQGKTTPIAENEYQEEKEEGIENTETVSKSQEKTADLEDVDEKTSNDSYEDHNYQIVIGSHRSLDDAEEQRDYFHNEGYTAVKVIPSNRSGNLKKVIWDSFKEKSEADSALRHVRKNYVKDAWRDEIKH